MITLEDLKAICTHQKGDRLSLFIEPLNATMDEFEINNPERETMFLAQIAHESGEFNYLQELASGKDYEGRVDLGNDQPGDGVRYKGRGLIQITGKANYRKCGDALGLDLIDHPELLEDVVNACRSAGWFWKTYGCNEAADAGDFRKVTRKINGGYNGWLDRVAYLERAKETLA